MSFCSWFGGEKYKDHFDKGVYACANCGEELFHSSKKFEHHTPWPAFYDTVTPDCLSKRQESSTALKFTGPDPPEITVSERAAVNSIVTNYTNRVTAKDNDLKDSQITFEVVYSTAGSLGAHYFGIRRFDSRSMDIYIRNTLKSGYTNINIFQLQVVAYDALKPHSKAYKDVIIKVLRNEGVPKWTCFRHVVKMREDLKPYGIVAEVNATDKVNKDTIAYSIQDEKVIPALRSGKPRYFHIERQSGIIKLKQSVIGTKISSFKIKIQACDNGVPSNCISGVMKVKVTRNRLPPKFSSDLFVFFVLENEAAGFIIGNITSADNHPVGSTMYELINSTRFFELNRSSGQLSLKVSLRNRFDLDYRFGVRAYDTGEPLYVSTTEVIVNVIINPSGPVFLQSVYKKDFRETFSVGDVLFDVSALDADGDILVYTLVGNANDTDYFSINSDTGVIKLAKSLVNPPKTTFQFLVEARDQRCVNEKKATANVQINIKIDHAPYFNSSTVIPPLQVTAKRGDVVHTLIAEDPDLTGNMTYRLVGLPPAPYMFTVDSSTGVITLSRDIIGSRLEEIRKYTLKVEAYDSLLPNKKASQTLTVDVNPGAPQLKRGLPTVNSVLPAPLVGTDSTGITGLDPLKVTVSEGPAVNSTITEFSYRLEAKDGDVKVKVQACDKGVPPNCVPGVVIVKVVNDHLTPVFSSDTFEFFMFENEDVGYSIGNITSTDSHPVGATVYELINPPMFFKLNRTSGELSLNESLRNDFALEYRFQVIACDKGEPLYVAKVDVIVRIFKNPSGPVFNLPSYIKEVRESFAVCETLLDVDAQDADGDTLVYKLVGDANDLDYFFINPDTGVIKLAKSLVNPPKTKFTFMVAARDQRCVNEKNATASVVILVDADDAPGFVSSTVIPPLRETAKRGDVIHTVLAKDPDLAGNMTYKLVGRPPAPYMFSVDSQTGVISLSRDIHGSGLEKFKNYTLEIEAYDSLFPNKKATQTLIADVILNPNGPVFDPDTFSFALDESKLPGSVVGTVVATDMDGDTLTYSFVGTTQNDTSAYFFIIEKSGEIRTKTRLTEVAKDLHTLMVKADDGRGKSAQAVVNIVINRKPLDAKPVWLILNADGSYNETVLFNIPVNSTISRKVKATDIDLEGKLRYEATGDTVAMEYFEIDSVSGHVKLKKGLNTDTFSTLIYRLFVAAFDTARPANRATTVVYVKALRNPSIPRFDQPTYKFTVFENKPLGYKIGQIQAVDDDSDKIIYSMEPDNFTRGTDSYFSLQQETGYIVLKANLTNNRSAGDLYQFTAIANDQGTPPRFGRSIVYISVGRDRAVPAFQLTEVTVTVDDKYKIDQHVTTVSATDQDLREAINYVAVGDSNAMAYFKVGLTNGSVSVNKNLMLTKDTTFRVQFRLQDILRYMTKKLEIEAYDTAVPSNRAKTLVNIFVVRNGDTIFFVNPDSYFTTVNEYRALCGEIFRVKAIDPDGDSVSYRIVNTSLAAEYFYADPRTGAISIRKTLAKNRLHDKYVFTIEARDSRCHFTKFAYAIMTVNVKRNMPPIIGNLPDAISISKNVRQTDIIFSVEAFDPDLLEESSLVYSIVGHAFAPGYFKINEKTGKISVSLNLHYANQLSYTIRVRVYDSQLRHMPAFGDLTISISNSYNPSHYSMFVK